MPQKLRKPEWVISNSLIFPNNAKKWKKYEIEDFIIFYLGFYLRNQDKKG